MFKKLCFLLLFLNNKCYTTGQNRSSKYVNLPDFHVVLKSIEALGESKCAKDFEVYVDGVLNHEKWALTMFDSTVKFPFGLMYGNNYQLGNFDECIGVVGESDGANDTTNLSGQYCLVEIAAKSMRRNITFEEIFGIRRKVDMAKMFWAICVPSSCVANETRDFVKELVKLTMPRRPLVITVANTSCHTQIQNQIDFTAGKIIFCLFIVAFLIFIMCATGFHCFHLYKKQYFSGYTINAVVEQHSYLYELFVAFSVIKNVSKLFEIKTDSKNDDRLDFIFGIRTISMCFILAGHALIFLISAPHLNKDFVENSLTKWQNAIFLNNPLLVDTFLLISGFLMCRLLLAEVEKSKGRVNIAFLYIGRYVRLTPAYLVILCFYCTFLVDIGSGPLWKSRMQLEQDRCLSSWWANMIYLNNYIQTDDLCMFQSWYLSVDTQLFLLAPLLIFLLWHKQILGEILLAFLSIISALVPFMVTCSHHLDPTLMIFPPEINDLSSNYYFKNYYIKTHMRAHAYLIGMLIAYIAYKAPPNKHKIPATISIVIGFVAFFVGLASLTSILAFYQQDYIYNPAEAAFYASLHRIGWCFAIGWTLYVCMTEGTIIYNFLSWKAWAPFSKLTYCAYLVNGLIELYSFGQTRSPRFLSTYNLACETVSHIVITFFWAFILCVLFESPIHNLEKLLLRLYHTAPTIPSRDVSARPSIAPSFDQSSTRTSFSPSILSVISIGNVQVNQNQLHISD